MRPRYSSILPAPVVEFGRSKQIAAAKVTKSAVRIVIQIRDTELVLGAEPMVNFGRVPHLVQNFRRRNSNLSIDRYGVRDARKAGV